MYLTKKISFKQILSFVLTFMICLGTFMTTANAQESTTVNLNATGNELIKDFDEVKILNDTEDEVTVKAIENNIEIIAKLNKNTSEASISYQNKAFRSRSVAPVSNESNPFKVQIDMDDSQNINVFGKIPYKGKEYNLDTIPNYTNHYQYYRSAITTTLEAVLGGTLIKWLAQKFLTVTISGVKYALATSIIDTLKNKTFDHYMARLQSGKLYIGNPVDYASATNYLRLSMNIWSKSAVLAKKVAVGAGNGKTATPPEIHNKGKSKNDIFYYHYHTYNRAGGHSFYGVGYNGTGK